MRVFRSTAVAVLAFTVVLTVVACGTGAITGDAGRATTPTSSAPVDRPAESIQPARHARH